MATTKPSKITKAPKRRNAKQYTLVSFELEAFEGEFTLPKLDGLPFGVASALQGEDGSKLVKFIRKYAPESADAVEDLDQDELGDFFEAWGEASGVNPGK